MAKKRTYQTDGETLDFGEWLMSDGRRFDKEKEVRAKIEAGMTNPTPAIIAFRTVTKADLKEWKILRGML